jgi:heme-degrading monooxygenase HmoA
MHSLVVEVSIEPGRTDEANQMLQEQVVPAAKGAPGFVAGYWLRSDDGSSGTSVVVFETEDAARQAGENLPRPPEGAPVSIKRFRGDAVAAHA